MFGSLSLRRKKLHRRIFRLTGPLPTIWRLGRTEVMQVVKYSGRKIEYVERGRTKLKHGGLMLHYRKVVAMQSNDNLLAFPKRLIRANFGVLHIKSKTFAFANFWLRV